MPLQHYYRRPTMKLSDAIGLELERREKVMDDCEKAYRAWAKSLPPTSINRTYGDVWKAAWDYQQARIEAAIEVYAGMEGFIPETAAEGYCLRIIEQMNEALQESDDERV